VRIVFMGTPSFAVSSLQALDISKHEIAAVVSRPDSPKSRGMKPIPSDTAQYALKRGFPLIKPESIKDPQTTELLRAYCADIFVVVAFGSILTKNLLEIPPLGTVNVHGSLLPAYRGAAPIQWAVLNGEKRTGVSTMFLDEGMDTGDVIDSKAVDVGESETFGELYQRLARVGAELLIESLNMIENKTAVRHPQDSSKATYAPPITREMCPIDWNSTPEHIINKIRGLNPSPSAVAELAGTHFKIHMAEKTNNITSADPGSILNVSKKGIEVACGNGATLMITQLQAPGGKKMSAADYANGHRML